jgi:hypothetical protein
MLSHGSGATSPPHGTVPYSTSTPKTEPKLNRLETDSQDIRSTLGNEYLEPTPWKIFIFPASFLTMVASILLIASLKNGWHVSGAAYVRITENRASAQIIVQVLAGLLGAAQVSTLRTLVNYSVRRTLARRPMSLDRLNFYNSLVTSQINWSLPPASLLSLLVTILAALAPAAIWAGALTPINVPLANPLIETIAVPAYSNQTQDLWTQSWYTAEPTQCVFGTFTYGTIRSRYSYFINDGSNAFSVDGGPAIMRKGDNTNYTYYGRSYGVGSSVGINDTHLGTSQQLLYYSYSENGYQSLWSCEYNTSSSSTLELLTTDPRNIYLARGSSPIADFLDYGYLVTDLSGGDNIVAAKSFCTDVDSWKANYSAPYCWIVIMAKGSQFAGLNNIQCAGSVIPTLFQVDVDVVNKVITAIPTSTVDVENIDNTGWIASRAGDTLASLSLVSTTAYTSVLGDMLDSCIFNVRQSGAEKTQDAEYTRGVAESLQALSDQQLFSYAGAQLIIARDGGPQPVVIQKQAMGIGQDVYIYASAALSAALVLALLLAAIKTRLWHGMPRLNFADVKSTVVASSCGGASIAQAVHAKYMSSGHEWVGNANDRSVGKVEIILRRGSSGLALSTAA